MIGDNLAVPFETRVLGVTVTVRKIDYADSGIVAICARGKYQQAIPAAGQDSSSRHARPGSTADAADLPG